MTTAARKTAARKPAAAVQETAAAVQETAAVSAAAAPVSAAPAADVQAVETANVSAAPAADAQAVETANVSALPLVDDAYMTAAAVVFADHARRFNNAMATFALQGAAYLHGQSKAVQKLRRAKIQLAVLEAGLADSTARNVGAAAATLAPYALTLAARYESADFEALAAECIAAAGGFNGLKTWAAAGCPAAGLLTDNSEGEETAAANISGEGEETAAPAENNQQGENAESPLIITEFHELAGVINRLLEITAASGNKDEASRFAEYFAHAAGEFRKIAEAV